MTSPPRATLDPLSADERHQVERLLSDPFSFPFEFTAWLRRFIDLEIPSAAAQAVVGAGHPDSLNAIIDGLSLPILPGIKGDVVVDFDCTIIAWTLLADTSGDAVVDVLRSDYAGFPPSASITGSNPPQLIGQDHARDNALDGWSPDINGGDVLRFSVASASAVTQLTLDLTLRAR